jgi:isoquinoline 1-oxidoreductase subunit beta
MNSKEDPKDSDDQRDVLLKHWPGTTSNFSDYPILTMSEIPDIDVSIITNNEKMGGVGEPPLPPVAPAVANAVFAAASIRMRSLPMTPDLVRKALASS